MATTGCRSHLSWSLLLQLVLQMLISTLHVTLGQEVSAGSFCITGQTCVDNATCISNTCQCVSTHYQSGGVCLLTEVSAGSLCLYGETCVDHASCISYRCRCDSTHYESLGVCLNKVSAGSFCTTGQTCVDHASCISSLCKCDSTHYENLGVCLNKVAAGSRCTTGQTCADNATCIFNTCQCVSTHYQSGGVCLPTKVSAGSFCLYGETCVDHASCISYRCQCDSTHYENLGVCLNKLTVGSVCTTGQTCVDNATCISNTCQCASTHYPSGGVCLLKVAAGDFCATGQTCVDHAYCILYRCQCDSTYYESFGVCLNSNGMNVGVIVAGVLNSLAALVAVVVIIFVFVMRRRKRHTDRAQSDALSTKRISEKRFTKLRDFKMRLAILHRASNLHFQEEFEELCSSHRRQALQFTMHVGNKPINRVKNRNQYAIPYDHSRVVLMNSKNNAQDYINASYIAGADSPCEYIATQGPLYSTLSDFWKMIYEHRTRVIVMLCDSVENGKKMVDQYWPDKVNLPVQHGDLTVTMTGTFNLDTHAVRKMTVTMRERQDLRVTQLCIRGWSELGCSLPVEKLIDVIRVVGQQANKSSGPLTVHCNLGVGRTGMFIALDLLTRFVDNNNLNRKMNVYAVVKRMLGCRPYIIHTLDQYMFIHDVLGVIIEKKTQNGCRGTTPSAVYQNHGHTVKEFNTEHYDQIREENIYSTLNGNQMK